MTLRIATICSGIGAPEVAAHVIGGFESVFVSEIDPFPSAVLAHHCPGVPNLGDFTTIGDEWNGKVDVLVGGTPCQSFSVAGKRLGLDDPRGNLTLEFLRLVGRIRPRWVVWENVPGVLSDDGGRTFDFFCRTLRDDLGFEVGARVLDARFFGVPQRRRRVFVVGGPRGGTFAALRRDADRRAWRAAARFATWPEAVAGDAPGAEDRNRDDRGTLWEGVNDRIVPSLTASGRGVSRLGETRGDDPLVVTCAARNIVQGGTGHLENSSVTVTTHPNDSIVACAASKRDGLTERGVADAGECAPTLRATPHDRSHMNGGGGGGVAVAYCPETADPILANEGRTMANAGKTPKLHNVVAHAPAGIRIVRWNGHTFAIDPDAIRLRRLTPMECERLQGFTDDWTAIPWRGKPAPDSRRYKAVGNSMAVPVLAWILEGIRDFEEGARA